MLGERPGSFFRKERSVFLALLTVYVLLGLAFVFLGRFWADENWYFGGSWLVASGELPYRDFFIHHNPVFFYVYALPQALFGPSLVIGRLTSLVFMALTFVLAWRLSRVLGGLIAALITAGLLVTNLFIIYYYNTFSYRVLEAFLVLVFFAVLFGKMRDSLKYPLAAVALSLVVGIRFPIDIISGLLGLYLLYVIFVNWRQKRVIILSLSSTVLSLAVVLLPFVILAPDQYMFATINFNFLTPHFWVEAGIIEMPGILERIYRILLVQSRVFLSFTAVSVILFSLIFYIMARKMAEKRTLRDMLEGKREMVFLAIFVLICELLWMVPAHASAGLRTLTFPAAAILAGTGLAMVLKKVSDRGAAWLLYGLIIGLMVLTPFAQFARGGESQPTLNWSNSPVKYITDVAGKVSDYTKREDKILTFTPVLAVQAHRELVPGTVMELYNLFPTWETEKVQEHRLLNMEMLLGYLSSREADAVVLTEERFFSGENMSRVLDDYRPRIMSVLEDNYHLAEKLDYPPEVGRGDVYIYLPKE